MAYHFLFLLPYSIISYFYTAKPVTVLRQNNPIVLVKVGLTGGIGSGKTTVARIFETLGVPVYYADIAARTIMNTHASLRESIITHFGEQSYTDGLLNREYIADIVFNDKGKLDLLNSLTHPATIEDANDWMKKQTTPYAIKEAALLFESGSDRYLDFIIGVSAPLSLRVQRTMQRDNLSRQEVQRRMDRQMDEEQKMRRCDIVLINDDETPLLPQVLQLHEALLKKATLSS